MSKFIIVNKLWLDLCHLFLILLLIEADRQLFTVCAIWILCCQTMKEVSPLVGFCCPSECGCIHWDCTSFSRGVWVTYAWVLKREFCFNVTDMQNHTWNILKVWLCSSISFTYRVVPKYIYSVLHWRILRYF